MAPTLDQPNYILKFFIPKILVKMSHTSVKNTLTLNKIPRPDPKIFLKMFPDPGPVSVWSGEIRGFGFLRRSLIPGNQF